MHVAPAADACLRAAMYWECNICVLTCVLRYTDGVGGGKMWQWWMVISLDLVDMELVRI